MEILGRHILILIESIGFEENLYYTTNNPIFSGGGPSYNGNISSSTWTYNNQTNGYMYYYDNYNRLSSTYSILDNVWSDMLYSEMFNYDKNGNIRQLYRFNEDELTDLLNINYDGNQIKSITDEFGVITPSNNTKHYQDLANQQTEFEYDRNGNMTKDLDRNICAIQYNVLNLPSVIQFRNGNQISHVYDATGNRVQTTYYSRKSSSPITTNYILHPEDSLNKYDVIKKGFNENVIYKYIYNTSWITEYIKNPEGYMWDLSMGEYYPCYYIKDHVGNNCQTWIYPYPNYKECIQRMQYYPSGLPWNQQSGAVEHPYRYNGKEFVEQFGLDEYDSTARWYYPAIARTTTMDPLCEKYYDTSPYAWCGNNPVKNVDLNGMDTLVFDADGIFIERIEAEGSHVGKIINSDGLWDYFYFVNQSDANRFGLEYDELYVSGEVVPSHDTNPLKGVKRVSYEQISKIMQEADAYNYPLFISMLYALLQSENGKIDYVTILNSKILNIVMSPELLFLPQYSNYAHDMFNFGNFLWGYTMYNLGIPYPYVVIGAHGYNIYNCFINKEPIKLDSKDDQLSILLGYFYDYFKCFGK